MPWPMEVMTTKCIPLNQASLYYCIFVAKKKGGGAMSPHGRRQMLKHFCLNLFISFCLDFDLAVNVLCLEILWNLLDRLVWAYRAHFLIHSLPSSVALV